MANKPLNTKGSRKRQVRETMKQLEAVATARRKARPVARFKIELAPLPKSAIPKIKGKLR